MVSWHVWSLLDTEGSVETAREGYEVTGAKN